MGGTEEGGLGKGIQELSTKTVTAQLMETKVTPGFLCLVTDGGKLEICGASKRTQFISSNHSVIPHSAPDSHVPFYFFLLIQC